MDDAPLLGYLVVLVVLIVLLAILIEVGVLT